MNNTTFTYRRKNDWKSKSLSIATITDESTTLMILNWKEIKLLKQLLQDVGEVDDLCCCEIDNKRKNKILEIDLD